MKNRGDLSFDGLRQNRRVTLRSHSNRWCRPSPPTNSGLLLRPGLPPRPTQCDPYPCTQTCDSRAARAGGDGLVTLRPRP
eukprot:3018043-Prymnesium_polylepis.1